MTPPDSNLELREIILQGSPYERGFQHGSALKNEINNFLDDNRARINTIRHTPLSNESMDRLIKQHTAIIEEDLPEIAEEIKGLAAGASIDYSDAVLLQIRRELIAYEESASIDGDCSTIAYYDPETGTITGQTIDIAGDIGALGYIFRILPSCTEEPEILIYGFAGLIGYLGMNNYGLSVNINMVVSDGWKPGVSPYLLSRHILNFKNIDECIKEIEKCRISSSRCFTITSRSEMITVEITPDRYAIINDSNCLLHTNHYMHESMKEEERMHFLFHNSSKQRFELLKEKVKVESHTLTSQQMMTIFSDHSLYPVGICAHSDGNLRRSETVAAVTMQPNIGLMVARKGNTCKGVSQEFKMNISNN